MNRIMNVDDLYASEDDEKDDDRRDDDFWNEDRRHAWDLDEYDGEVDHCDVQMKLLEIGSVHAEMSTLAKKMKHLVHDLKIMRGSEQSWPHALGAEIRPLFQLTKQMMGLQRTWDRELALVNECVALRRNDELVTAVDNKNGEYTLLPRNYGRVIGSCLRYNTRVTDLTVNLGMIHHPNTINSFLYYIQTSRSLQRVELYSPERNSLYDTLATRFLCAVHKSPSITELKYFHLYIPPTEFAALMSSKSASPINDLSIELTNLKGKYTVQDQELLVRSIASSNLTRLHLSAVNDEECNVVVPIFHHLTNNPTPLSELSLRASGDDAVTIRAVTEFLKSTQTLQNLKLEFCEFNGHTMNCFLDGLKHHYSKPTASMTKLSFTDCEFDNDASAMFMRYMQTPVAVPHRNRTSSAQALRELKIKFGRTDEDTHAMMFDGKPFGEAMVSLISRVHVTDSSGGDVVSIGSSTSHTIGSQLERVSLCPVSAMTGFWPAIASNAKRIDVPKLQLSLLEDWDCSRLERHLYKLRALRELHLSSVVDEDVSPLVHKLQENDFLHSIVVEDCKNHTLLNPWDSRFLKACCERNKYIHEVRKNITRWNEDVPHPNKRPKLEVSSDHYDNALLIPMLMQSAKQVHKKIKLNNVVNVVSALLAFEADSV